jgi:hypothetical protein
VIKTAAQLLAEVPKREWRYPPTRRSRLSPPEPCKNAYRGCPGIAKGKHCGHGWCGNCYSRWKKHDDSWHHSPNVQYCTKVKCFMKGTPGHP